MRKNSAEETCGWVLPWLILVNVIMWSANYFIG
jgi:hypothetical protein